MNFPLKVIIQGKGPETLDKNSYVAAGGEGTVCRKGGTAYKIYHDPKKMIAIKKIQELSSLKSFANILCPQDIVLDAKTSTPVGFTMPFVDKTDFLCRAFNKGYKQDNGITDQAVVALVKNIQETIKNVHKNGILIVDLNELNLLVDSATYETAYFIDVDSWQTATYKATALMESVRDRFMVPGQFNEGTDWFSFAIVSFEVYTGFHPYQKGQHPNYKPKDWSARMDAGISVFHPEVTLSDVWKGALTVIPKPHLEWYKRVFHKKERTGPPLPEGTLLVGTIQPVMVAGNASFEVTKLFSYKEKILGHFYYNGLNYVITEHGIYQSDRLARTFNKKYRKMSLAAVSGYDPVFVHKEGSTVYFEDMAGTQIGLVAAADAMQYGGRIYTIYNGKMTENTFRNMGKKVLHLTKEVSNIFEPATKLFPGVAVQDILSKCWLAIPYAEGKCASIAIPELNGERILDAKCDGAICILISEKAGKYKRTVLHFNDKVNAYSIRVEDDVAYEGVNFTYLSSGVCVHVPSDSMVELFRDNSKVKTVANPPFTTDMKLSNDVTSVLFVNDTGLYTVKLK